MEPEPEEPEYDGPSYYSPLDDITGMTPEQKESIEKRFRELDSKYHANVDGGVHGLLERDQAEWDLEYSQYYNHLLEENPRMRKSTAKKKTDDVMGARPEYSTEHGNNMRYLEVGGEYFDKDNVFTMTQDINNWQDFRHVITLNPHQLGADKSFDEDIQRRIDRRRKQDERVAEGRRRRNPSNVSESLEGSFIHEYGHAVDYTYGIHENEKFLKFFHGLSDDEIESVSIYACTNEKEFIAEAFCESFYPDTQGDVSKRFMKVLEGILHGKR